MLKSQNELFEGMCATPLPQWCSVFGVGLTVLAVLLIERLLKLLFTKRFINSANNQTCTLCLKL